MSFVLGHTSTANLAGVHPRLVAVVQRCILGTAQDFSVNEGVRSLEAQRAAYERGDSKLLHGMHQPQADGFGHAVDLVPYVDGRAQWLWGDPANRDAAGNHVGGCYAIAAAMREAAEALGVPLRWGGVWDRMLSELGRGPVDMAAAVHAYVARHPGPDFLDGPHFELPI